MTAAPGLILRQVHLNRTVVDIRIHGDKIAEIGRDLPAGGERELAGRGGTVLPGLHDHHLHLLAYAARRGSVDCSAARSLEELEARLATAEAGEWIRAVGYSDHDLGALDRHDLDRLVPDRPVRLQHRSGALWVLNSAALARVAHVLDDSTDVERDSDGAPTGRLWRYDQRLRAALPAQLPDLATVGADLDRFGITGVTDATPDLDAGSLALLGDAIADGQLPPILALGAPDEVLLPAGIARGPHKLLLRDHDLPTYDELRAMIHETHDRGRAVAVHCVTRESLLLVLAILEEVGPLAGDRIEHGSVIPPEAVARLAHLGVAVVTQPGFIATRGEDYLAHVAEDDLDCLYPWASLLSAGVRVAGSSDAPLGPLDPWFAISTAVERRAPSGRHVAAHERVTVDQALAGYLSPATEPGGTPRRIAVGAPADLCVLDGPIRPGTAEEESPVVLTVRAGELRFGA